MSGHDHDHDHNSSCGGGHGHDHNHGHDHDHNHDHNHDHSVTHDGSIDGDRFSLYKRVDLDRVICLNESQPNSGRHVLRPWDLRLDPSLPQLESAVDPQMLLCIPFISPVRIRSFCIIGGGDDVNPSEVWAYVNDEVLDFDTVHRKSPTQRWQLQQFNPRGDIEHAAKYSRFQNVSKLWLYFHSNFGADVTRVMYIGLKGQYTEYRREAVQAVYESRPLAQGRKIEESIGPRMGM